MERTLDGRITGERQALMRKVLVISYYWPPAMSAGAQRIFKFCKYLPEFGYETVVVTGGASSVASPPLPASPGSRLCPVTYWFDPARWMGGGGLGEAAGGNKSMAGAAKDGLLRFAWLNLFIPDARIGWYRPSRRAIRRLVEEEKPDVVFSTAPPYTAHLLGRHVKERYCLPWVVEMRDPWLESHVYNAGPRLGLVRAMNRRLESDVLEKADRVVCATGSQRDLLAGKLPPGSSDKFTVIMNGYDSEDDPGERAESSKFHISYLGTSYPEGFPYSFFDILKDLLAGDGSFAGDFVLRVIGQTAPAVRDSIERTIPAANVDIRAHMAHDCLLEVLREKQLLLLVVNEGRLHRYSLPSKIFEYLPTGNPVLGIGPADHEVCRIVEETGVGAMFPAGERAGIENFIMSAYENWSAGRSGVKKRFPQYERRTQSRQLAEVFESVL